MSHSLPKSRENFTCSSYIVDAKMSERNIKMLISIKLCAQIGMRACEMLTLLIEYL